MVRCSVLGCKSDSERKIAGLSFHSFPAEPESRNLWIEATKRNNWVPKKSSKICSQHFHGTSFMKIGKKTFLNPKTVPLESEDSSSGDEIKVFCPKCNTEVSHTAEGIQEDQTKILIAKVYHYFEQEYEELKKLYGDLDLTPLSKFRQRTVLATGVSETTLLQILKEEEERNADKRQEPPQRRRAARKRRRQTDSSSEGDSSDDNGDDIEQPSHADEVETLVVKMEPTEYNNEEPEIFIPAEVKVEPGDEINKTQLQMDPISLDVKTEPRDDEVDTTNDTVAHHVPADTKRKGNKIPRKSDDIISTRQHTRSESSAPVASSSVPLTETLDES